MGSQGQGLGQGRGRKVPTSGNDLNGSGRGGGENGDTKEEEGGDDRRGSTLTGSDCGGGRGEALFQSGKARNPHQRRSSDPPPSRRLPAGQGAGTGMNQAGSADANARAPGLLSHTDSATCSPKVLYCLLVCLFACLLA